MCYTFTDIFLSKIFQDFLERQGTINNLHNRMYKTVFTILQYPANRILYLEIKSCNPIPMSFWE